MIRPSEIKIQSLAKLIDDPRIEHDLAKIQTADKLKIPLLIQWCRNNKALLEKKEIRTLVECLFFKDNAFLEAIRDEPMLISSVRSMVDEQIRTIINPERCRESMFWIMLAYHLETQAEVMPGSTGVPERIAHLQSRLNDLADKVKIAKTAKPWHDQFHGIEYDLQAYKCYVSGSHRNLRNEDLSNFMRDFLVFQQMPQSEEKTMPDWIASQVNSMWNLHRDEMFSLLGAQPDIVTKCLQPLLKMYNIDIKNVSFEQSKPPQIKFSKGSDHYNIDLIDGSFRKNGMDMAQFRPPRGLENNMYITNLVNPGGYFPPVTKVKEGIYETLDGKFRFQLPTPPDMEIQIFQKFLVDGKEEYFQFKPKFTNSKMLPEPALEGKRCWMGPLSSNGEQIIYLKNPNGTTFLEGKITKDGTIFTRTAKDKKDGKQEKLVRLDVSHPIGAFLNKSIPLNKILVWAKESPSGPVITRIEIPEAENLSFTVKNLPDGHISVVCDRHPEYELAPEQGKFNDLALSGAINLKHLTEDKTMILMPMDTIQRQLQKGVQVSSMDLRAFDESKVCRPNC